MELPPVLNWIRRPGTPAIERRDVPAGLWAKCPRCATLVYRKELERKLRVCPRCNYHHRLSAADRLALVLDEAGKLTDAETLHREALAIRRKILGEGSPAVAESVKDLAAILEKQGKITEAEQTFIHALRHLRKPLNGGAVREGTLELTLRRFAEFLLNGFRLLRRRGRTVNVRRPPEGPAPLAMISFARAAP